MFIDFSACVVILADIFYFYFYFFNYASTSKAVEKNKFKLAATSDGV